MDPPRDLGEAELWQALEAAGPLDADAAAFQPEALARAQESSEQLLAQTARRRSFIAFYAWSVPSRDAVAAIAGFAGERRLLEICAGSGLWARLLSASGVTAVATDLAGDVGNTYAPVQRLDAAAAVAAHPECRVLFACWPPLGDGCAARALAAFSGDRVVFAGDVRFTADGPFHALLAREWTQRGELALPSWPGLDDRLYLYERVMWP